MIWDELAAYTARKELSAKAVKEVVELLAKGEYSADDDISKLNAVLLKLNPEVLYHFFTSEPAVLTEAPLERMIETVDVQNPVKAGHICVAVIALERAGRLPQANTLLKRFVQENLPKKIENKSLYEGFRRSLKYGNDSLLFARLAEWEDRELNLYTRFLTACAKHLNDPEFTEATEIFCRNNGKNFVRQGGESVEETKRGADGGKEKPSKSRDEVLGGFDPGEVLKFLAGKFSTMQAEVHSQSEQIRNLKSENLTLKNANANSASELEISKSQNIDLTEKVLGLESKVRTLTKELDEARTALEKNRAKLDNVESAFGQAGQTEIDALKGNIRKRLSSEYEKYIAIKDKTPDPGYYEILLAVLEDVFRALKKNGIAF